ncbi:MAG: hypothetical protein FD150_2232 [Rhodobacteraceae bacterium]|nr:MAG: hypothetical protein FD150_2232 [Paracoccaceae bacterium]
MRAAVLLALWPALAAAETPMTGAEFQAHVGRNTFSYGYSTGTRSIADYGADQTVLWAFQGDRCVTGRWYADGKEICFANKDGTLSACWHFFLKDNRLRGLATRLGSGGPDGMEIFEISHTDQPLVCAGPDAGV